VFGNVRFNRLPVLVFISNAFAEHADGQNALQLLDSLFQFLALAGSPGNEKCEEAEYSDSDERINREEDEGAGSSKNLAMMKRPSGRRRASK